MVKVKLLPKRLFCLVVGVATLPLAPLCLVTVPIGVIWGIRDDKKAEREGRQTGKNGSVGAGLLLGSLPAAMPLGFISLSLSSDLQ